MEEIQKSLKRYARASHIAVEYDRYFYHNRLFRFDTRLLDEYFLQSGPLVDFGCGTGRHIIHFAKRGFPVTGVDISPHMLDVARKKLKAQGLKARLIQADMREENLFEPEEFQYAISMFSTVGMIPAFEGRLKFFKNVLRILRKGGFFAFHTHNRFFNILDGEGRLWLLKTYLLSPFSSIEVGDRILPYYRGLKDMYLHIFSVGEVKKLLRLSGFALERIHYLNAKRSGELKGGRFRSLRANGFVIIARKPAAG